MNRDIPKNIDAEQSVIGSMFLTLKALKKALENLQIDSFYLDSHKKIFECMLSLDKNGKSVDLTTVAEELNNRGWLNQVGGVEYLTEVIEGVPTAANIDEYIKIVENKFILRKLIDSATDIITESYNASNDINELIETSEKKIFDVSKNIRSTEFKNIQDVLIKTQSDIEKLSAKKKRYYRNSDRIL